jgi:hypothetical protein
MQTSTTAKLKSTRSLTPVRSPLLQRKCACGNSAGLTGTCSDCQTQNLTLQRRSIEPTEGAEVPPLVHELLPIQTKLTIGKPGDVYEQEANQIADRVMRMPEPSVRQVEPEEDEAEGMVQKEIADKITPLVQRQVLPDIEEEEKEEVIQTKAIDDRAAPLAPTQESFEVPSTIHEVLSSPGQPLDPETRAFMEPRFGHDFSRVRVHSDAAAERSAREVNAHAYTVGHDIVFGTDRFTPGTQGGRRLIAHELTHVVQQSGSNEITEHEADTIADAVTANAPMSSISRTFGAQFHRKRLPDTDKNEHAK